MRRKRRQPQPQGSAWTREVSARFAAEAAELAAKAPGGAAFAATIGALAGTMAWAAEAVADLERKRAAGLAQLRRTIQDEVGLTPGERRAFFDLVDRLDLATRRPPKERP